MLSKRAWTFFNSASKHSHLVLPITTMVILLVLLVPLPPILLDILISLNILLSVVLLLVSIYVLKPVDFTAFPTLLLITTLYRLALNVATARLILLHGDRGVMAAGSVIHAFGEFVVGGNYVVGLVIFIILLVIQFIVVNHGAVRSSEVMARFTLDAMPGKQMAVDADLTAGIINEHEAKRRRAEISQTAEFHGSMDGAIRFTQRDAVATVLITIINILGGFVIGLVQHGLSLADALNTYTILTVGDGIAAAVPSLFVSVAAAIITTRAATETSLGSDISTQLLLNPRPLFIAAVVLMVLGLMPNMPHLPFILLACTVGCGGYLAQQYQEELIIVANESNAAASASSPAGEAAEKIESLLKLDMLALEVGYGLIPLVSSNGIFLNRMREIRRQVALDLGIIVPSVHVTDNLQLGQRQYAILIKGIRLSVGELRTDSLMAIDPGIVREKLTGLPAIDPVFNMPAIWIPNQDKDHALSVGYTVVEPTTIICTHLAEVIKEHAYELLGRQETRLLLDELAKTHPKTVEETTPKVLSLGEIQRVLQNLLRENIPIRDLPTILEALGDAGSLTHDANMLTETARLALSRTICHRLANENGELPILTLDPVLEQKLVEKLGLVSGISAGALEPDFARNLLEKIESMVEVALLSQPVILCSSTLRPHLRKLAARFLPNISVLSHGEIAPNIRLISMGTIS